MLQCDIRARMRDTSALSQRHVPAAAMSAALAAIRIEPFKVACSSCNLRELCLPVGMDNDQLERLDELVGQRRTVPRGEPLFRAGDAFQSLFAVRTGFFKTCVASEDGREQVTGFQMAGEVIGLDGIGTDRHTCDAVALEDSQVCVIPYSRLEDLTRELSDLQEVLTGDPTPGAEKIGLVENGRTLAEKLKAVGKP